MGRPLFGLRIAIAAAAMCAAGTAAQAQMAVFDASSFAQTLKTVANTADMARQMKDQYDQMTKLTSVAGLKGSVLESTGLAGPVRTIESALNYRRSGFDLWQLPRELANPNFTSIASSRDFVDKTLRVLPDSKTGLLSFADRDLVAVRRSLVAREAASNGWSLAVTAKEGQQAAFERFATISTEATQASDLMEQLRVTNKLLAAIGAELVTQRALLASVLENQSGQTIASLPVVATSTATTNPGMSAAAPSRLGD